MTVLEYPLTSRVPVDASFIEGVLCVTGIHSWSRWEPHEAIITEGRKSRTVVIQLRECVRCGLSQRKPL